MNLNFNPWDLLLQKYVDDLGRVNYQKWKTENPTALSEWLKEISLIKLSSLEKHQQLALWINLYNALTIAEVLATYPIKSIRPEFLGLPNWLGLWRFFQRPIYKIDNHSYSLNDIENKILRQQFNEPRIHFALVCASVGCPLLRPGAYIPEKIEEQLKEDAYGFINNPAKVRYDGEKNILYLNPILRWYRADFLKIAPSIPEYIQLYLEGAGFLSASVSIEYVPYDWSLNQRISA